MYYLGIAMNGELIEFMLIDKNCHIHGIQKERHVDLVHDGAVILQGIIESGIARVCLKANIKFEDISFACVAVPGFGENQVYDDMMNDLFATIFYNDHFICENEIEAAWTGALGTNEGIVILAGVGSIAIGKNKIGETVRTGGWGHIAGDEGGEYWLARKILEIYTKEADGRYDEKILYKILREKMKIHDDDDIFNFSFEYMDVYDITFEEFVDIIFEARKQGDSHAVEVIQECADEYIMMIQSIIKQITFKKNVNVSFLGRIFLKSNELLGLIVSAFDDDVIFTKPQLTLVAGAALRALMFRQKVLQYDIYQLLQEEDRIHQLQC
ncbi:MAG: hypothetical protein JEZ08_21570 [Clostridiales bacterium]|nr:hypothetical protein [Clostridiales bacterium]